MALMPRLDGALERSELRRPEVVRTCPDRSQPVGVRGKQVDPALRALADANRRALLTAIRTEPRSVGCLAEEVGLSQQTASHHVGVIRVAGLATVTRHRTRHIVRRGSSRHTGGAAAPRLGG